jgi:hypothetical protein
MMLVRWVWLQHKWLHWDCLILVWRMGCRRHEQKYEDELYVSILVLHDPCGIAQYPSRRNGLLDIYIDHSQRVRNHPNHCGYLKHALSSIINVTMSGLRVDVLLRRTFIQSLAVALHKHGYGHLIGINLYIYPGIGLFSECNPPVNIHASPSPINSIWY